MNEQKNDAFEAMTELLQQKKNSNELKKISEIEDVEKEIEDKVTFTEEETNLLERYEIENVADSIDPILETKEAEVADLSNISVVQKNDIERNKLLMNALKNVTSTFEITAAQSGYTCKISPLNNKDSFNILNTSSSEYETSKSTYKVIYDKITEFSCGHMTFENWLKNTAVGDLESFYYGLYCATFLDEGGFRFTCPDDRCGHVTDQIIRNKSLKQVANYKEMQELTNSISLNSFDMESMKKLSLLSNATQVKLDKTGFIFEIKIPSLWDLLELYRTVDEKVFKNHDDAEINALVCTTGILIPEGNNKYVADQNKYDILEVLDKLPISDAASLKKTITNILEKYHVSYSIKSVKCAKCGKEIKNVPIDLRSILFTKIYAMR